MGQVVVVAPTPTKRSTLINSEKYIGLDDHQATMCVAVMDPKGKVVMESILESKATTIRGLNKDDNHDLKGLFKTAATRARKIGHYVDSVEKGENFDAEKLKAQAA